MDDELQEQDGPAASSVSVSEEELVLEEQTEKQQMKDMAGETAEKQIKEVVEHTDRVVGRISKLLLQHRHRGRHVSSTDSVDLWFLRYMEVELSGVSESLKQLPLPDLGPDYIDYTMSDWFRRLTDKANDIGTELDNHEQGGATVRCFCAFTRASLPSLDPYKMKEVPDWIESPCRYKHLLLAEDDEIITSRVTSSLQLPLYMETYATRVMPLVGIESALGNKELRWFMDDQHGRYKGLKIISMVGPAGVGKTAIAMELYRRLQTRSGGSATATVKAVAKVSRRPDMKKLLLHILSQIHQPAALALPSIDELELELLVRKISQCLQHRRYLILIDDIWKISDWESMKDAFPPNSQGSRIVMTTRIRSVASGCCLHSSRGLVHEVKSLCEVDSKMLLSRKAFGCEVNNAPENLSLVCAEILRRCEGIPLFIHGMADWLQEQHQRAQSQHMFSYSIEEAPQLFERALSPSYDDLTYKMKLLLLYMSTYPEGYMFEIDTLRRRWRADVDHSDPDDFYILFSQFIDRNVITPVANWRKGTPQLEEEEASQYKLNHFMLQFLASKLKGFICTSGALTSVARSNRNEMLRRISLHRPDRDLEVFLKKGDFSQTRSLAISSPVKEVPLNNFIHLVVLDLEGWQHLKDTELSMICNSGMLLLQFFSVRNTSVSRLPPEIKKLRMLHTLVASHTQISELPSELCELRFLDTLDVRSTKIRQLPAHIWKFQGLNTLLVGDGWDGVNCDPTITMVPREDRCLSRLESVDLSDCSPDIVRSLGFLKYLGVVCIRWFLNECSNAELQQALCSAIQGWERLESLTIHCALGCQMDFLVASLPNLTRYSFFFRKFKVTGGRFVSLSPWFQGLGLLTSIEITFCRLEQRDLGILASLPSLKCLVLGLHFVPEKDIVIGGGEGFPMLEKFSVCCRVPWLTFSEGAMPSLPYLELKIGGGNLLWNEDRIPSGLGNLRSLRELVLHYNEVYSNDSNVKTIVDAVRKGVAQHHYPINLVINGVQDEYEYVQQEATGSSMIRALLRRFL